MPILDALVFAGMFNALLLAVAAGVATRRDRRWAWLCALLSILVVSLSAIVVTHRTEGAVESVAVAVEQLSWASGPVLYHFVLVSMGYRVTFREAAPHFAIPAAVILIGTPMILLAGFEPLPAEALVLFQIVYTVTAFLSFLRRPERDDRSAFGFWWPSVALSAMAGIHGAQLARMSPWGDRISDVVPMIGSVIVMAILFLALAIVPYVPRRGAAYAKSSLDPDQAGAAFQAARSVLQEPGMFRRADLCLGDVSNRLGISLHHLSQAISTGGGTSFKELLGDIRVAEARRLLLDPRNAGVAIEPLGMEAGFRSRSVFYACFRSRTGVTPAEFRRRAAANMSGPTGEDMETGDDATH